MSPLYRILLLWRRQWPWLAAGAIVSVASVLTGAALLALAGAHVAVLLMGATAAVGAMLTALGPARVVLRYAERLVTHSATFRALASLRVWFFRRLAARSAGGLGMQRSGDLASRLVADVEALDGLYLRILVPLASAAVLLLVLLAFLVGQGAELWLPCLGAACLFAVSAFVIPGLAARSAQRSGVAVTGANAGLRVAVLDALSGLREVRMFGAEARMAEGVAARDWEAGLAQGRLATRAAFAQAGGFLCAQLAIVLLLLSASSRPVSAVGAVFLLVAAFEATSGLSRAGALAGHAAAAARRVLDAAAPPANAVAEPATPVDLPRSNALRFDGVHFRWAADRPELFDGLTLEVPQGSRVAILGPSGCGKSTLAALLLKITSPSSGRILLGGADLASLSAEDVRSRFGVLSQSTHLFDDTIRANLLLGRPAADEPAIWRALDEAEIGEFVRSLPEGLDTWLGEGGARVSGGQGRRIALARTLLSEAPILVLDEPGAGLDAQTERAFLKTLNDLPSGRTLLLITHRLTGAERLDRIWRLSGGHAIAAAA
ncbi:thiol reductant ABC exporter subunit CydC [Acidisphaera sp. L21]|uniref:thiol reductant ABC exporter subunit CydC n=1 Tax=Acidisphaera sp. L21 TaxID=1641851 RepID=UPI00131DFCD7|nr:thiol reductant ABC exporter subunit CydC [Acidisphaera sp. L21]